MAGRVAGMGQIAGRDLDDKELGKWLDSHPRASALQGALGAGTRGVSVPDREGDLFQLLAAPLLSG